MKENESKENLDVFIDSLLSEDRSDYIVKVDDLKSIDIIGRSPHLEWKTESPRAERQNPLTDTGRRQLVDGIGATGANAYWKKNELSGLQGRIPGLGPLFDERMGSKEAYEAFVNKQLEFLKRNSPKKSFRIRTIKRNKGGGNYYNGIEPVVVRAVVSPSYMAIDDADILPGIREVFSSVDGWEFLSVSRTEERTYLKFVQKEPFISLDGRDIHMGIMISNSETGNGAYKICIFLCDDYCTNGMVFAMHELIQCKWWHKRIARTIYGLITPDEVDISYLREISGDVRQSCIDAFSDNTEEKERMKRVLVDSTTRRLPMDKIGTVFSNLRLLGKKQRVAAIENIESGPLAFTQYGVASAITSIAKKCSADERIRLEEMGASVIMWDEKQWERALMAA